MAPRHNLVALGKFASDELIRAADGCASRHELAAKLGLSQEALRKRMDRLRKAGHPVPTFGEQRVVSAVKSENERVSSLPDFVESRWPSVKALEQNEKCPNGGLDRQCLHEPGHEGPCAVVFTTALDGDEPEPPPGYHIKGKSTLYRDGEVVLEWVKTSKDADQRVQMLLDAMSKIADKWMGLAEPVVAPAVSDDDLLVTYGMGDPHIGMFSPAKRALIVNVGDFFHADTRGNTTTSGTPVDSDGRWPKVLATGVRLMRRCIDRALMKHDHVTVITEIGNHDWHTSIMLATCLAQFYENEPRVTIDTSPAKFHWYRFGKVLIGTTHGDTIKLMDLGEIMAADRPQDWGETQYRYWLTGHVHHDQTKELRGCIVRTLRTLAPSDAWHKGQGYRSGQDMRCMVFHREWGQINEHTVGIAQVRAAS